MPEDPSQHLDDSTLADRVQQLELRVRALESRLADTDVLRAAATDQSPLGPVTLPPALGRSEDELEFELGQNWFAKAGIVILTAGAALTITLPFSSLPRAVPSLFGYVLVAGLLLLTRLKSGAAAMLPAYLRAAAMVLLYLATLRLYFFGDQPVLATATFAGMGLLILVEALNVFLSLRWNSPWLFGLALGMVAITAITIGSAPFVLTTLVVIATLTVGVAVQRGWLAVNVIGIPLSCATYLGWALHRPAVGQPMAFVEGPLAGPLVLLASMAILASGCWLRRDRSREDFRTTICALLICVLGYGVFLVHTFAAFSTSLVLAHLLASLVFLGLAIAFWVREQSRSSTFFYAMTGYASLTVAIIKAAPVPAVFVWLSLQSLVVVATAIWFRSRFIVVANFAIYVAIVAGYVFLTEKESGISVGFGIVALASARILNWQQNRLELKTGLMRNAYLVSAFFVFPYALQHLVPGRGVALAWVGLAIGYYALGVVVRNQKYRWMGHGTLLLTAVDLVFVGMSGFEPVYRVLSFLALGTVLVAVSVVFARLRKRAK